MQLLAIHALIIMLLLYSAITLHFLTLKFKKNETQKRQRKTQKVLHSKPGRNSSIIDETPTHFTQTKTNGL
jgi:cell division protein FtsN